MLDLGTGDQERFELYFELMRRAAPLAAEAGLGITMKPHGGISLTSENLREAHARVGHPAFAGPCYVECVGGDDLPAIDRNLAFPLGYIKGIQAAL